MLQRIWNVRLTEGINVERMISDAASPHRCSEVMRNGLGRMCRQALRAACLQQRALLVKAITPLTLQTAVSGPCKITLLLQCPQAPG